MKHALLLKGRVANAYRKINGIQESNVYLFCDILFQVVHLLSFVHGQDGGTPLLWAARNGHVEIAQLLVEKGAIIEATAKVQFVAFVHQLTIHGWPQCEVVNIHSDCFQPMQMREQDIEMGMDGL